MSRLANKKAMRVGRVAWILLAALVVLVVAAVSLLDRPTSRASGSASSARDPVAATPVSGATSGAALSDPGQDASPRAAVAASAPTPSEGDAADEASLSGRVAGEDGAPLEGARVCVGLQREIWEPALEVRSSLTDVDGEFRFPGPWPKDARLVLGVDHPAHLPFERRDVLWDSGGVRVPLVRLSRGVQVSGWAVDAAGDPVRDAEVRFDAVPESAFGFPSDLMLMQTGGAFGFERRAQTDDAGRFELRGHWPLRGWIAVRAAGFAESFSRELDLAEESGPVAVELARGHTLSGRVSVGPEALPDVEVLVQGTPAFAGERMAHQMRSFILRKVRTNAAGEFAAQHLAAGSYRVEVQVPGLTSYRAEVEVAGPTRHEVALTAAGAIELAIEGNPRPGDLIYVEPIAEGGAPIELEFPEPGLALRVADVAPGDYRASSGEDATETFRVRAGETVHVTLTLARRSGLSGRVLAAATGDPVAGARVWLTEPADDRSGPPASIPALFLSEVAARLAPEEAVTTDAEGRFAMDGVAPGAYAVHARHRDFAPTVEPCSVAPGAAQPLRLKLSQGAGVRGRVQSSGGAPVAGALVVVRALPEGLPVWRTTADEAGRFALQHLPPGELEAALEPRRDDLTAHSAVDPFLQYDAVRFQGENGEVAEVTLVRDAPATLQGLVRDADGPVADARVVLHELEPSASKARPLVRWARTAVDGSFVVERVEAGAYEVSALAEGAAVAVRERIEVAAGGSTAITLDLPAARVVGRVLDGDRPVVGAVVRLSPEAELRAAFEPASEPVFSPFSDGGDPARPAVVRTDDAGTFELRRVPAGRHTVTAQDADSRVASARVVIDAAEGSIEVELAMGEER